MLRKQVKAFGVSSRARKQTHGIEEEDQACFRILPLNQLSFL
jgi:hypothetical protein